MEDKWFCCSNKPKKQPVSRLRRKGQINLLWNHKICLDVTRYSAWRNDQDDERRNQGPQVQLRVGRLVIMLCSKRWTTGLKSPPWYWTNLHYHKRIEKIKKDLIWCKPGALSHTVQDSAKRWSPGLVSFVTALAYLFSLALPATFMQPGDLLLA